MIVCSIYQNREANLFYFKADSLYKTGPQKARILLIRDLMQISNQDSVKKFVKLVLKADTLVNEYDLKIAGDVDDTLLLTQAIEFYEKAGLIYSQSKYIEKAKGSASFYLGSDRGMRKAVMRRYSNN